MHAKLKDSKKVCITYSFLFLFLPMTVQATEQKKSIDQHLPSLNIIIDKVKKAVRSKNFDIIKPYVSNKELLYWTACGPGDVEPEKLSFANFVKRLSEISKGAEIYVREEPDIHLWDFEKPAFYAVDIHTEGWTGEYPFLSFGFNFRPTGNRWEFRGVCDSTIPELTMKDGKYVTTYFREPQLPRPGPRIFKDLYALRARIEEIVRFKAFDSLSAYAPNKVKMLSPCNSEIMEKDRIVGTKMPVNEIINFLKRNAPGTAEIKPTGIEHNTYYETVGWRGEYPVIAFWFSEGQDGWEWAGVSYCKTKHTAVLFPKEPLFK